MRSDCFFALIGLTESLYVEVESSAKRDELVAGFRQLLFGSEGRARRRRGGARWQASVFDANDALRAPSGTFNSPQQLGTSVVVARPNNSGEDRMAEWHGRRGSARTRVRLSAVRPGRERSLDRRKQRGLGLRCSRRTMWRLSSGASTPTARAAGDRGVRAPYGCVRARQWQ